MTEKQKNEQIIEIIKNNIEENGNLKAFTKNFKKLKSDKSLNNWKNIFCIEPIRWSQYKDPECRYKKSNFSFFYGNIEKKDESVLKAAQREALEEGCMNIDESIFSTKYQQKIRRDNKISTPLVLEYPFNKDGITYWSRVYLLFLDLDDITYRYNGLEGYQKASSFFLK